METRFSDFKKLHYIVTTQRIFLSLVIPTDIFLIILLLFSMFIITIIVVAAFVVLISLFYSYLNKMGRKNVEIIT